MPCDNKLIMTRLFSFRLKAEFSVAGVIFLCFFPFCSPAQNMQDDDAAIVYAVTIEGNRVTDENLILREMSIRPGLAVNEDMIEADRLRLLSLGLFNKVEISVVSDKGRAVVLVQVYEPFYLYCLPLFRYDLENPNRSIWGFTGYHRNFRGRAERLRASGWTGFNRGIDLSHRDPWFSFLGGRMSLSLNARYEDRELTGPSGIKHRREELKLGVRLRRRLEGLNWIGGMLQYEERSSPADFYTYSGGSRDRIAVAEFEYQADSRDYWYYPRRGSMLRITLEADGMLDVSHYFFKQRLDFRKFIPVGKMIFAGRIWAETSQHDLPYYRRISLSTENIRARIDFGTTGWTCITGNSEVRFNILSMQHFSLPGVPYAGPYLLNMPFSIEGVVFFDYGYIGHEENDDWLRSYVRAWGGGLQFQLPFVETAHVLAGWHPGRRIDEPGIIVGTGVTF